MNYFTKEELNMMADGICYIKDTCVITKSTKQKLEKLEYKLCEMINNYCNHEWENTCCGCSLKNIRCDKCQMTMDKLEQKND